MVFVYTLIDNRYTSVALVSFHFLSNSKLEKRRKTEQQRNLWSDTVLTKGKKGNYKIEGKHPSLQSNKKTKGKSSTRVVVYMFLVLTIWPISWSSLLPYIWVCNFIWFPHRGKKERKRCSFYKKSCCFDCPQKRSANRGIAQRKKHFTIRIKDTILPLKEAKSSKDAPEPAFNWCLEYLCDCAHL